MKTGTRSILSELQTFSSQTPVKELIIEDRASHAIAEATDIIDAINANFDEQVAQDLEKRFINSIRTGDANKFLRAVKKLKEQKTEKPRSVLD
tara:strand:- start:80 stop:358 length:279 start_codon:yes stop_codon:yes gene_type:complete